MWIQKHRQTSSSTGGVKELTFETQKPESWSWQDYAIKLEKVIDTLQKKNDALKKTVKMLDFLSRNDFLSAKEQNLEVMKKLQELDQRK